MPEKNYYHILQVPPQASYEEIKKAYRSLAKKYHPDVAEKPSQQFLLINEAYTILGDPIARETYHYRHFFEKVPVQPPATSETILQEAKKLVNYIDSAQQYFINYDKIETELTIQCNISHFQLLLGKKTDSNVQLQVVECWLQAIEVLPFKSALVFYNLLQLQLQNHPHLLNIVQKQKQQHLYNQYMQQYTIPAVVVLAVLLCWLFIGLMP